MQRLASCHKVGIASLIVVSLFGSPCLADRATRQTIPSGGVLDASSESHRLSSALGQPVIGRCASAGHILTSGFWGMPRVTSGAPAGLPASPASLKLLGVFPNPSLSGAAITFELPRRSPVEVKVFDVGGRLARALSERNLDAGRRTIRWDSRNDAGEPVAAGLYLVRIAAGSERALAKILVLR